MHTGCRRFGRHRRALARNQTPQCPSWRAEALWRRVLVGSGLSSLGNSIDGGKNSATGAKELTSDNAIKPTVEATMPTDKLEVKPNFNNVDTSKINAPEQSFNPNYINKKRIPIQ